MTDALAFLSADARAALEQLVDERVEQRLAELESARPASESPYLNVDEAADYLRCSRQRVYDLLSARRLTRHKDGSRTLVRRDELDDYLNRRRTT